MQFYFSVSALYADFLSQK